MLTLSIPFLQGWLQVLELSVQPDSSAYQASFKHALQDARPDKRLRSARRHAHHVSKAAAPNPAGRGLDLGERGRRHVHHMHARARAGRPPRAHWHDVAVLRRLGALAGAAALATPPSLSQCQSLLYLGKTPGAFPCSCLPCSSLHAFLDCHDSRPGHPGFAARKTRY